MMLMNKKEKVYICPGLRKLISNSIMKFLFFQKYLTWPTNRPTDWRSKLKIDCLFPDHKIIFKMKEKVARIVEKKSLNYNDSLVLCIIFQSHVISDNLTSVSYIICKASKLMKQFYFTGKIPNSRLIKFRDMSFHDLVDL